jgi:hypothetical protein
MDSAEYCRHHGYEVGTRLVGDEGYGPTVIEITAIGEKSILAKVISHAGVTNKEQPEGTWVFWCRDWKRA